MSFSLPYIPHWKRNVYIISLGVFIAQMGFSAVSPFLAPFIKDLGLNTNVSLWSGLIFSVSYLTYGIMSPIWGSISDRYGKKPMMARAGLGMSIIYFLMAGVQNHLQLFILRGLNGFVSGYTPAAVTFIVASSESENLNYSLAIVQAANALGNIMGPLVGGTAAKLFGIRGSMVFTGVLLIAAAFLPYVAKVDEKLNPKPKSSISRDIATAFRNKQLAILFIVWLLVQGSMQMVLPTLSLFIGRISPENVELYTGIIFSIVGISTALGAPVITRVQRFSTSVIFRASILLAAIFTALQGFATTIFMLGSLRFIFGFFNSSFTVTGNVLIAKNSDRQSQGSSFGVLNGVVAIGQVLGPILGGLLGDGFGLSAPFLGGAAVLALAFGLSSFIQEPEPHDDYV